MEFYNSKDIKSTRKDHDCFLCKLPILKKSACFYESGKYDGSFFSRYSHHECSKKWIEMNSDAYCGDDWIEFYQMKDVYPHDSIGWWRKMINEKYNLGFDSFDMTFSDDRDFDYKTDLIHERKVY